LAERSYDVVVGEGARHELAAMVARVGSVRQAIVVTQRALIDAGWLEGLNCGLPHEVLTVPEGEAAKSLATVETLCSGFAQRGLARGDVVVALGGGVVTDVAGFAAASFHRGTAYVNVATTLLAQVDAAVGGKTGVNLPEGKNLLGAFWQPAGVLCDTEMLATLSPREWASGRGEMAKYAFLAPGDPDASLLDLPLDEQVARCVALKAEFVSADEREGDRRMILNYGHTLAHALEAAGFAEGRGDLRHGEAVAIGLVYAALLARRLGRIDDHRVELHRRVVGAFDLPTALPAGVDPERILSFMARDKKAQHDLTFVLDGPGGVEPVRAVGSADVLATLAEMKVDQ
jgi:5-deoxy-5-amino-3-dehydroquinate synthase